jgi:methylaspartate ammonia-lyase
MAFTIKDGYGVPGTTGFYFDDQRAIKKGAFQDGFFYRGTPVTPGFEAVRQAGESLSIVLELEDGTRGIGDCASVQYSGSGGRDPLFLASEYKILFHEQVLPRITGIRFDSFLHAADYIETLTAPGIDGTVRGLHTALRYGLSQALLSAAAGTHNELMCETICREYGLPLCPDTVPLFAQSGDDRYTNADKMIIKEAQVLPHALINNIDKKLGRNGEKLAEYITWLRERIRNFRINGSYRPSLHIDVYGTVGLLYDNDAGKITEYLAGLGETAAPFELYIEGPVDAEAKEPQIALLYEITAGLKRIGSEVKIVADEWCNTKEDIIRFTDAECCHMVQIKTPDLGSIHNVADSVLYCKTRNMEAYQGGTCNETDLSARACVHVAMAVKPDRMLAKPGMGFDEGYMITHNEMARISAAIRKKQSRTSAAEPKGGR